MKKILSLIPVVILTACSQVPGTSKTTDSTGLPPPAVPPTIDGQVYMRAKAEFNLTSAPSGSAKLDLIKKTYAAGGNCQHGQCTDFSDITVVNTGSTQFALTTAAEAPVNKTVSNQNITALAQLNIGTLFDNEIYSCNGQKCTAAAIRIYTTDDNGTIQGAGLWSQAIGQSVPLTVSGGSSASVLAPLPYFSANGTPNDGVSLQVDSEAISTQNLISLVNGDFSDANPSGAGYTLSADFTQAGAGTYLAHVVVEYDLVGPSASAPTLAIINTSIAQPLGIATDASGNLYVADASNNRIIEMDSSGNQIRAITTPPAFPDHFSSPSGVAVDSSGNIYVANLGSGNIIKLDLNGNFLASYGQGFYFYNPYGVAVDSTGNIYVADTGDGVVYRINLSGQIRAIGVSAHWSQPYGVAVDSSDNIYVADAGNNNIVEMDPTGTQITVLGSFQSPLSVTVDTLGNVWTVETNPPAVVEIKPTTGNVMQTIMLGSDDPAGLLNGITVDSSGNVFVTDQNPGVLKISF